MKTPNRYQIQVQGHFDPALLGIPLRYLTAYLPDVSAILILSAAVALGWCILRTILAYFALRTTSTPTPSLAVPR